MTARSLCLAVVVLASSRAVADPKADAREHIEKATAAHAAGKFTDALQELTLAYALDPDPELLFAIGQVHMKLGDCTSATTFYERFIATKSDPKEDAIARKAIKTCKDHPPEKPAEPPPPPPPREEPKPVEPEKHVEAPVTPPPPPPPPDRPWYRDVIGDVLVVGGVAAGAVALVEYRGALDSRTRADTAPTYGGYRDLLDEAHHKQALAIGFAAAGGTLALAGVIHYVLTGGKSESPVAIVPTHGGQLVTWSGHF